MRSITTGLAALTVAVAIGACGGDEGDNAAKFEGDEKDVAAVVDDLQAASRDEDAGAICDDIFTDKLAGEISVESGKPCAEQVKEQLFKEDATITVQDLTVQGDKATATVQEKDGTRSKLALVKQGEEWRLDDIE